MFTGIITGRGTVQSMSFFGDRKDLRIVIDTPWPDLVDVSIGASIACSGCCLTVVKILGNMFFVDVSEETLRSTTISKWCVGSQINLERALRLGDEIGGHIVSGHIDGIAEAVQAIPENDSMRWRFRVPTQLSRLIARKGSITVDGVSLTVNDVDGECFDINVIPHTAAITGFSAMTPGDKVNIEVDMLARYIARIMETK